MQLKDKVVLITGSSSGIGSAIALRFAQEGCKVVINYKENRTGALEVKAQLNKLGMESLIVKADVTRDKDIEMLISKILKRWGRIDILINNAAIPNDLVPYLDATSDDMRELFDTNIIAPMYLTQKVLRVMNEQGYGKILNTSSIRGWESGGRAVVYSASKAALNSFTKTLAKQVSPNITVNAVAPGFVKTRNYEKVSKEMIDSFIGQTQLKRWVGGDEVADAFAFLAKSDALTGQVIYVDAGFTLK